MGVVLAVFKAVLSALQFRVAKEIIGKLQIQKTV